MERLDYALLLDIFLNPAFIHNKKNQ